MSERPNDTPDAEPDPESADSATAPADQAAPADDADPTRMASEPAAVEPEEADEPEATDVDADAGDEMASAEADEPEDVEPEDVEPEDVEPEDVEPEDVEPEDGAPARPMSPSERRAARSGLAHGQLAIDPALRIKDRASAIFVLITVGAFVIIFLNALVLGHGGLLAPVPTFALPTPIVTPAPTGTAAPTVTAAPTATPAAS